jgi:hypothetical protein
MLVFYVAVYLVIGKAETPGFFHTPVKFRTRDSGMSKVNSSINDCNTDSSSGDVSMA